MGRRSHRSRKDIKLKLVAEKHFRKQLMISVEGGGRHQQFSVPGCCECRSNLMTCASKPKCPNCLSNAAPKTAAAKSCDINVPVAAPEPYRASCHIQKCLAMLWSSAASGCLQRIRYSCT